MFDVSCYFHINGGGYNYEARKNTITGLMVGAQDACNANRSGITLMDYYHQPYNQTFTAAARASLGHDCLAHAVRMVPD